MTKTEPVTLAASEPEAEAGAWCPTCLVPSAYRIVVYQLCPHGVRLAGVVVVCLDCEQWELE